MSRLRRFKQQIFLNIVADIQSKLIVKPAVIFTVSVAIAVLTILGTATLKSLAGTTNSSPQEGIRDDAFLSCSNESLLWTSKPLILSTNPLMISPLDSSGMKLPTPGIYETPLFACQVKVPEPTGDNCILKGNDCITVEWAKVK
jgi:hypothetical protein